MRDRRLSQAPAVGLGLGAALMLASCAGPQPPVAGGGAGAKAGLTQIDGANVELASFRNSAFPYHGLIPNYQETGKTKPFLDVDDNGRLAHSSPRGGLLWEDQTYNSRLVLLAAPDNFDASRPGGIVACRNEADAKLGEFYPHAQASFRRMPFVIVAYSGGYLPAAYSLTIGGEGGRVRGVVLLDALYGEREKFVRWVEGPGRGAFFVSAYSTSSKAGNDAVRAALEGAGLKVEDGLPASLTPGVIAFVDAGQVAHNDFVTSAWGGAPLRDVFSRMRGG